MADVNTIQFTDAAGNTRTISLEQAANMTIPQFYSISNRIHRAVRDRVYDIAVWDADLSITPNHQMTLFRNGVNEDDETANGVEYKKTLAHTNMPKNGQFEKNDLTIIQGVEIEFPFFGGKPTRSNGLITNSKVTFPATVDPAAVVYSWLSQLWVEFKRGKDTISETLAINLPQSAGLLASYGANSGAYAQNGEGMSLLANPQIIDGSDDFTVVLTPLAASWDNTAATGLNQEIDVKVVLNCLRLETVYS